MEQKAPAPQKYQPLLLLRNVRYPTYQLHAYAGGRSVPAETVLKIVILETMAWLRQRFRAFELPAELDLPAPADHARFALASLRCFCLDMGYKLQAVWLPAQGIWTMQLTEPDLGTRPGAAQQEHPPVPGRLFETNVAYRRCDDKVECGFKTVVHEPLGTDSPCEVFRLAFIKQLARNPLVGLRQGWQLTDGPHRLAGESEIKKFARWLADPERMLPAAVFSEYQQEKMPAQSLSPAVLPDLCIRCALPDSPALPADITDLSRYRMGYAVFFVLPVQQFAAFARATGQTPENGGVLFLEPQALGGGVTRIRYEKLRRNPEKTLLELNALIQNYPRGKAVSYGGCVFTPQALALEREELLAQHSSGEEVARRLIEQREALETDFRRRLAESAEKLAEIAKQLERAKAAVAAQENAKQEQAQRFREQQDAQKMLLTEKEDELQRCRMLQERPDSTAKIAAWVEKFFDGRLLLHDRAKAMLQKLPQSDLNVPLICDALEYLATEYRDRRLGRIDEAQCGLQCVKKYGRPFLVTLTKSTSVEMYPADYKIKYRIGFKGKPVETLMDFHLKVGNDPANLLRIYFLYDSQKDLVVVGSLPRHLRIKSFR